MDQTAIPIISVLMCARNEEELLPLSLKSIMNQKSCLHYEVIVVDNDSTDRTSEIALQFTPNVFKCEERGKVPSLKEGLRYSSGQIIAFADADTIYPANWISSLCTIFSNSEKCQLAFGSSDLGCGVRNRAVITGHINTAFVLLSLKFKIACSLGFNMAVRKQALQKVLRTFEPVALSGWAIGTQVLRLYGSKSVFYAPNLRVPKCMRRYNQNGFLATCSIWAGEWFRLAFGLNLKVKESQYYSS